MKIDYIPATSAARWNVKRVTMAAVLFAASAAGAWCLLDRAFPPVSASAGAVTSDAGKASLQTSVQAPASNGAAASAALSGANSDGIIQSAVSDALTVPKASDWVTMKIKSGQNLAVIFDSLGLPQDELVALLALKGDVQKLKRIKAGDELHVRVEEDRLAGLRYALDERRTLEVRRADKGLEAVTLTAQIEHRQVSASGRINESLFVDGQKAQLSGRTIMEFADIFGYDIDFAQDIHPGDQFSVVYEQLYSKGKKLRDGDILAAEFVNQGQRYRAVRFTAPDGNSAYYTPQGLSLRKAFIRTPVDFARVTSPFNMHRLHPILHTIRAHKGVDYGASIGTPIKATGDGRVSYYGLKNGYGRVAMIDHGAGVETLYGHMSRFRPGLAVGSRVRQGQVIGYVGMSGLATAPHLHYEFRINGIHKNPMTVPLPRALPVDARYMAAFRAQSSTLMAALEQAQTRVALVSSRKK